MASTIQWTEKIQWSIVHSSIEPSCLMLVPLLITEATPPLAMLSICQMLHVGDGRCEYLGVVAGSADRGQCVTVQAAQARLIDFYDRALAAIDNGDDSDGL